MEKGMTTPSSILAWRIIMDRGGWWATVPGVTKSRTRLSNWAQCTLSYVLSRLWSQEQFNMPPSKEQTLKHELMFIHFDSLACSVIQSCMTLWNPMDYSLPGSSVHGIFQAWLLKWAAISFYRCISHPIVSNDLWPHRQLAHQALVSIEFSKQDYWSRLPFPSPGDLSDPQMKPRFPPWIVPDGAT